MRLLLLFTLALASCTENERARSFGGTMTVDLPCGEMLFDVTWKDTELWYATQPMPEGYEPRATTYRVDKGVSLYSGGTVVINECR